MSATVHVVSWEYDGGGGFDWFVERAAADIAEPMERACDHWRSVARFTFETEHDQNTEDGREAITREIDASLVDLHDQHAKPGRAA